MLVIVQVYEVFEGTPLAYAWIHPLVFQRFKIKAMLSGDM
jgi:hypothetical protein